MTKSNPSPNPMPITLQPGASALVALMKADPDFAIDVKRGVVSEIVRQLMPKDIEDMHLQIIRAEVNKVRQGLIERVGREGKTLEQVAEDEVRTAIDTIRKSSYTHLLTMNDPARAKIVEAVQTSLISHVRNAVEETLGSGKDDGQGTPLEKAIMARVRDMETDINGKMANDIERQVAKRVNATMEREIQRRVDERLAAIRAAIAA